MIRRLGLITLFLLMLVTAARAQTILTTSPQLVGTTTNLVLAAARYNEFNVTLTANTPIQWDIPIISGTLTWRLNICQNTMGGFTPTFAAVQTGVAFVNRVGTTIGSTAANYCETQEWSYQSLPNEIFLESNSPSANASGGLPGVTVTNTPSGANLALSSTSTTTAQWATLLGTMPGVTVTNSPSATNQFLSTTSNSTAAWGAGPGGVPTLGNPGFALFQNAAGNLAVWVACAGDVTCSAVTPGSYTVTAIQGNSVVSGVPGGDAYFYVWNQAQSQFLAVPMNGDVTMSNSGRTTVSKINGATAGPLATQPIPCLVSQGCNGTDLSASVGILRGGNPITASELSGDVVTNGSNAAQVVSTTLAAPLPVAQGGTAASAAGATAANNIGAAELGANTTLTSLANVTSIKGYPVSFFGAMAATEALSNYGGL